MSSFPQAQELTWGRWVPKAALCQVAEGFPSHICDGGGARWLGFQRRHPRNHDTLEGLVEIGGDGEGGWEEGGEGWLLGCGIGVARKER